MYLLSVKKKQKNNMLFSTACGMKNSNVHRNEQDMMHACIHLAAHVKCNNYFESESQNQLNHPLQMSITFF